MRSEWVDILIYLFKMHFKLYNMGGVDLTVHPHSLNYGLELMNKKIDFYTMNASYLCLSFILLFREREYAIDSNNGDNQFPRPYSSTPKPFSFNLILFIGSLIFFGILGT